MNIVDWLENNIFNAKRFEASVRKYGADTVSGYGSAILAGVASMFGKSSMAAPAAAIAFPAVVAGVSFVNKLDHDYKERNLLDFYRDQIAAVKGEENSACITIDDLKNFAEGKAEFSSYGVNPILSRELRSYDRQLALSIGTHVLAAAAFAAVGFFVIPSLATISPVLIGLGSALVFDQIDRMLGGIGNMIFSSDKSPQPDIVHLQDSLHKGDRVTKLQVYSVMVKSSRQLQERIKSRYGDEFDNLYLTQKKDAMMRDSEALGLSKLTKALNNGSVEAEDIVLMMGSRAPIRDPRIAGRLQKLHEWNLEADNYMLSETKLVNGSDAKSADQELPPAFAKREDARRAAAAVQLGRAIA